MERSLWKDQELNRLESFAESQNISKNTVDYITQLIVRAGKYCGTFSDEVMSAPILFGLQQQGHIPLVEEMLENGFAWKAIGRKIGWEPKTLEEHYRWYVDSINVCTDANTSQH